MGSFTYPKCERILRRSEFIRLSENGRKFHNRYFLVIVAPATAGNSRLGITVTRKVGKAVIRNRIKRLVREFFRLKQAEIRGFWDLNVIAKREAAGLSSKQVFTSLEGLFARLSETADS